MKNIIKISFILPIILFFSSCRTPMSERTDFLLDTIITIKLYSARADMEECLDRLFEKIEEIETIASAKDLKSELYFVNQNASVSPVKISSSLFEMIELGLYYSELTDGAFDITLGKLSELWGIGTENPAVPKMEKIQKIIQGTGYEKVILNSENSTVFYNSTEVKIDLGAVAKGYAGNELKKIISDYKITSALLDLGGDITVVGEKHGGNWIIGIADPFSPAGIYKSLEVKNTSFATSGNYERYFIENEEVYHHIFDRNTGFPSDKNVVSSSVITHDPITADAISTAFFVLGSEGADSLIEKIKQTEKIGTLEVILINDEGEEWFEKIE